MFDKERHIRIKNENINKVEEIYMEVKNSKYRQKLHISPLTGLINDPNGFSFYNGSWHVFYQWFPFNSLHGIKNWYHVESKDLVKFENKGLAVVAQEDDLDNFGAYSGSAIVVSDKLNLIYTGNNKTEDYVRHPNQRRVVFDGKKFIKDEAPIIFENENFTEHQRDPKVIFKEEYNKYFIILGAQDKDNRGNIILYSSNNIEGPWKYDGKIHVIGYENFGYMWECPDLITINGKDILFFSPQGLNKNENQLENKYVNGYIVGKMDFENLIFTPQSNFTLIDEGFDFYASQSLNHSDKNVIIAWMGVPDMVYPKDEVEKYSGSLTLPRLMTLKNNRIYQSAVDGFSNLRKSTRKVILNKEDILPSSPFEIDIKKSNDCNKSLITKIEINLFKGRENINKKSGLYIKYDSIDRKFILDRGHLKNIISKEYGTKREINNLDLKNLKIIVDNSSIEIFINDGEYTMTSRLYREDSETNYMISSLEENNIELFELETSVIDTYIL